MSRTADAQSSRNQILSLLRANAHTVGDLAETIDISPQAVRDQIRVLEGRGWIEVGSLRRDTGGKPAREYVLTAAGEESFEKPYPELLRYLVGELHEQLGGERKRELFEAVGRRIGIDLLDEQLPGVTSPDELSRTQLRTRLETAAEALNALGGAAAVEETEDGLRIQSHGCPLSGLVRYDQEACHLAEALVEAIIGLEVRESCDRNGRPRCRFDATWSGSSSEGN